MLMGPEYIPEGAKKAVILLHGFGSDGDDLFSLAPYIARQGLENVAFFAPNGPSMTDTGEGYQWFSDNSWTFIDREGIEEAKDLLESYIIKHVCSQNDIEFKDVAIVSFSQGTITSLFAAPRFQHKIAGIVALSGRIMWHEELENDESYHTMPIHLIHGEDDEIVEVNESYISYSELEGLGFKDLSIEVFEGLGHAIDERVITKTAQHLCQIFA